MAPRLAAAAAPPAYAPTPVIVPVKRRSKPRLDPPGLAATLATTPPFRERLLHACKNLSAFFQARRPLFRVILSEGERATEGGGLNLRQRWRKRRKTLTEAVSAIIAQGMASGQIRADLPADILAEYLLGMLRTRSWELEDRPESRRKLPSVVDLFLNGASLPSRPQ